MPPRCPTLLLCICLLFALVPASATATRPPDDYQIYHQLVRQAEVHIARHEFNQALTLYEQVFDRYEFVFRRDYQVATQLAWKLGRTNEAFSLLNKGIASGWTRKSIRKTKFISSMRQHERWKTVRAQYDSLRHAYRTRLDADTRGTVQVMFRQDQWKALGALFRFRPKARDRYALRRFALQSERHLAQLRQIIRTKGYPGEQLIGNGFWAATMLSHHNSIAVAYTRSDTLYPQLKPALRHAVRTGQMSPFEFACVENWAMAVGSDRKDQSYGYLGALSPAALVRANQLRSEIGLRSVAIRNKLIDVQQQTGMNFFLPAWPYANAKLIVTEP